ncbi:MAG TPA: hypothetical protein VMY42_03455 [Thermoguttaceae bacterium]|nr:hypothetical protein [Thermoguttaceae bacterium]
MKTWQLLIPATVCVIVAGCRADPGIAQLERANLLLEDEIYRLRWELEDCQTANGSSVSRDETWSLPSEPADEAAPDDGDAWSESPRYSAPPLRLEGSLEEVSPGEALDYLRGRRATEPPVPTPHESFDGPDLPGPHSAPDDSGGWETAPPKPAILGDSRQVAQIVLDQERIRGYGAPGQLRDEGMIVVVEPFDATGLPLDVPGDVSVVVLDPALEGEAARVARWEFSATETADWIRRGKPGIELTLPWPDGSPTHADLHLFVRYVTADGRKLEIDSPIRVASFLPGVPSRHYAESPQPPAEQPPRIARPTWTPDRRR